MPMCVCFVREQSQLQSKIHSQLKTFEDLSKSEKDLQLSIRYKSHHLSHTAVKHGLHIWLT